MIHITDKYACCGCGGCVQKCPQHCISLLEDEEGFLYPSVDAATCVGCGLCEKVCPVLHQDAVREPLSVHAAVSPDEEVRLSRSSGGLFTELASVVIRRGGVVFGARFNSSWDVVHDYTESLSGLSDFRGSKYLQSRTGDSYRQAETFLRQGREVLFTGTPCQIAGLRHFLGKEYTNLLTLDFICHGVPSPGVFRRYLSDEVSRLSSSARKGAGKNSVLLRPIPSVPVADVNSGRWRIDDIRFRDKEKGWKKYSFVLVLSQAPAAGEKNTVSFSYSQTLDRNAFMRGFLRDLYLRPSCHKCPAKGLSGGSDITLGDYWGIQSLMPEIDDDRGVSAVLTGTAAGRALLSSTKARLYSAPYDDVKLKNPALVKSAAEPAGRAAFFKEDGRAFHDKIDRLCRISMKQRAKSFLVTSVIRFLGNGGKERLKRLVRR